MSTRVRPLPGTEGDVVKVTLVAANATSLFFLRPFWDNLISVTLLRILEWVLFRYLGLIIQMHCYRIDHLRATKPNATFHFAPRLSMQITSVLRSSLCVATRVRSHAELFTHPLWHCLP